MKRYSLTLHELCKAFEQGQGDHFAIHDALIEAGLPFCALCHFPQVSYAHLVPCKPGECILTLGILNNRSLKIEERRCKEWHTSLEILTPRACRYSPFCGNPAVSYDKDKRCERHMAIAERNTKARSKKNKNVQVIHKEER